MKAETLESILQVFTAFLRLFSSDITDDFQVVSTMLEVGTSESIFLVRHGWLTILVLDYSKDTFPLVRIAIAFKSELC
jgi:hypothetical protein